MDSFFIEQLPELPVAEWVTRFFDWLTETFSFLFDALRQAGSTSMDFLTDVFLLVPAELFILLVVVLAFFATKKKFGLPAFALVGLLYIHNQGMWEDLMSTLTLVLFSSVISIVIGIPLGIWMAKSRVVNWIFTPILDFMQTMPSFVYLLPAVAFFGIGMVPGVFASVIFALPPTVRLTNLGIRQVHDEMIEAADSFGSTGPQKLFKVELPLAKTTIMAGVNQTVLLVLSMVVIAGLVGAPGLGDLVVTALQQANIGNGFVSGLALVVLAIVLDRILQGFNTSE
jgi:glycine betaine/proline transport system permease protein/glycine betaine/proline transport system substrate-binding protein